MKGLVAARAALGTLGALALLTAAAWAWARPALPPPADQTIPPFKLGTAAGGAYAADYYLNAARALPATPLDDAALRATPAATPDPVRFVAANRALLEAHRDALASLPAGRAHLDFQALSPLDGRARYAAISGPYRRLMDLGRVALHEAFVAGRSEAGLGLAGDTLALVGRFGRTAGEPLFANAAGSRATSAWSRDLALHRQAVLAAPTAALRALLDELSERAMARRTPQDMALADREWHVRLFQSGEGELADTFLARRMAAQAEAAAELFRPRFDRVLPLVGRRDLAAVRALQLPPASPTEHALGVLFHPAAATARAMLLATQPLDEHFLAIWAADARIDAWRVLLAAELHRRERGGPPASLAALVPKYLMAVPADPFSPTGAPLHFQAGRAWSIGPDGHDDGGTRDLADDQGLPPAAQASGDLVL